MQCVHESGALHRDLKPENVLLEITSGGITHCKVADFGSAKLTGLLNSETEFSVTGNIGTPSYMPPVLDP